MNILLPKNELLNTIFQNAGVGIILTDKEGDFVQVNPTMTTILGYTEDELLHLNSKDITLIEDISIELNTIEKIITKQQKQIHYEKRYIRKDNQIIWCEIDANIVELNNDLFIISYCKDISKQKEIDETHYALVHNSLIGIAILQDFKIVYANNTIEQIFGFTKNELYSMSTEQIFSFVPAEDKEIRYKELEDRIAGKEVESRKEVKLYNKNREEIWVESFAEKIVYKGKPANYMIYIDITKKKDAEIALKKNKRLLQNIVDGIIDGIYIISPDKKIVFYNKPMEQIIDTDAIGAFCYQRSRNKSEVCASCSFDKLSESIPVYKENFINKGKHYQVTHLLLEDKSKLAIFHDITDFKKSEEHINRISEKYKQLFNFMPLGVSLADETGQLVENNYEAERLLGISQEEHNERTVDASEWKIIRKDGSPMPPEEYASVRALKEDCLIENVEMGIWKSEEETTWINVTATPKSYDKGVIISYTDITEKVKKEEELKLYTQELKEANDTKNKFFSIIAHDLKNPFNVILNFSELLLLKINSSSTEKIAQQITFIKNSAKKTSNLLDNLLTWSRSQLGTIEIVPKKLVIYTLVYEAITLHSSNAKRKQIEIINKVDKNTCAEADQQTVSTILRNLISNAIKFTNNGGTIIVSATVIKDNVLEVCVKDNGVGISEKRLVKMFKIHKNSSTEGTNNEYGTGLGLILCREFIEKNKGEIRVESELGKGSSFYFTLPIACNNDSK